METKLAIILNTIFVTFTYGYALPLLYLCCVFPLLILSIFDKIMVTYWYKPKPKNSDSSVRMFISILKYAPFFCLLQCGWTVYHLGAMYSDQSLSYFTYAIGEPFQLNIATPIVYTLGSLELVLLFSLIVFDISTSIYDYCTRTKNFFSEHEMTISNSLSEI